MKKVLVLLFLVVAFAFLVSISFSRHAARKDGAGFSGEPDFVEGAVAPGQFLGAILAESGLEHRQAGEVTDAFRRVFDPRRLRPGDTWRVTFDDRGVFAAFHYRNSPLNFYEVRYDPVSGEYEATETPLETETVLLGACGRISTSLYRDMLDLGVGPQTVMQFADIFASRVDFLTDPRSGDTFTLVWESISVEGNPVRAGRVVAAEYQASGGAPQQAFFYDNGASGGGYFDAAGASLESFFLRAPLEYRRISSHFTNRRFHPIYKVYRPHLGIDYAAPAGTPVSTVGAGLVIEAGRRRDGFGNTVRVRHPNGYITYYGHLSRFAAGLRVGRRVARGQVVGYVGSTGTSTGPHLDFRIMRDGRFLNFLALNLPPAYRLRDDERPDFEARRAQLSHYLAAARADGEGGGRIVAAPGAAGNAAAENVSRLSPGRS